MCVDNNSLDRTAPRDALATVDWELDHPCGVRNQRVAGAGAGTWTRYDADEEPDRVPKKPTENSENHEKTHRNATERAFGVAPVPSGIVLVVAAPLEVQIGPLILNDVNVVDDCVRAPVSTRTSQRAKSTADTNNTKAHAQRTHLESHIRNRHNQRAPEPS